MVTRLNEDFRSKNHTLGAKVTLVAKPPAPKLLYSKQINKEVIEDRKGD